ncbi:MAG: NUDIX domain-containing protein [Patescibacteria group bacterium]
MKNSSEQEIPEIKDRELHRITTTTLVYRPDFTYLITRRALHKKSHPGKWTIPGGGLTVDDYIHSPQSEHGENLWYNVLEKSLKREIKEEVGLDIGKPELLVDLTFIRPDGIPVICFSCFTPYVSGVVKIDDDPDGDTIDFAWVNLEEAKKYDLIGGILDEISQVEKILKSRK